MYNLDIEAEGFEAVGYKFRYRLLGFIFIEFMWKCVHMYLYIHAFLRRVVCLYGVCVYLWYSAGEISPIT